MSGGGGGGTNTVQKADPWKGLQPYLTDLFSRSQRWLDAPQPAFYPSSTVGGQAPETLNAQYMATQRALQGSPLQLGAQGLGYRTMAGDFLNRPAQQMWANPWMQGAAQQGIDTMSGAYLGSNPYLDSMFMSASNPLVDQFSRAVAPSITSQFALGGRYGSGAHSSAITDASGKLGQALGTLGAQIYGPAYESERNRQIQSSQMGLQATDMFQQAMDVERARQQAMIAQAPQLAQLDYSDIGQLANVGMAREQRAQDLLNAEIARWDFGQNRDLQKLQAFSQLIQGGQPFGQTSSRSSVDGGGGFNTMGALGGALTGAQLAGGMGSLIGTAAPVYEGGAMISGAAPFLMSNPYGWAALAAGALLGSGMF